MTREILTPISKGVFSRGGMPTGWIESELAKEERELFLTETQRLIPDSQVIAEIPRSSHSVTFVVRDSEGLKVCQFGSVLRDNDPTSDLKKERLNPFKFSQSKARFDHLYSEGIAVPKVHSVGISELLSREFIVMEFVKGLGADIFLSSAPEATSSVYKKSGLEFGKLSSVDLDVLDLPKKDSKIALIDRLALYLGYLKHQGIFSEQEAGEIVAGIQRRFDFFPELSQTYVHLDPFPVNWHVSGKRNDPRITLMDIEAVQVGHPWIEGIGRALQWAGKDWFLMRGEQPSDELIQKLVNGFNTNTVPSTYLPNNSAFLQFLMDTSELFWLPQAMVYELLKDRAEETPQRRKFAILDILKKPI